MATAAAPKPSPSGKDLFVGSTVRLCNLTSERGKELNDRSATIVGSLREGRYDVRLIVAEDGNNVPAKTAKHPSEKLKRIKPSNMRVVCTACFSDQKIFCICSKCKIAAYCNETCQHMHWKKKPYGHKQQCKLLLQQKDQGTALTVYHPSWAKLSLKQRRFLEELHVECGCNMAWPVSGLETSAMLCPVPNFAPCFLTNHPNMRFKVSLQELQGEGDSKYIVPLIQEDMGTVEKKMYYKQVPPHSISPVTYAVVGEVSWTRRDYDFWGKCHASPDTRGEFAEAWPGGGCVGLCPGTGAAVPCSSTEKHLLVVSFLTAIAGHPKPLMRMLPRILSIEGYKKLVKGNDDDIVCVHGQDMKFYPDGLRRMEELNMMCYNNNVGEEIGEINMPPTTKRYTEFSQAGYWYALERFSQRRQDT